MIQKFRKLHPVCGFPHFSYGTYQLFIFFREIKSQYRTMNSCISRKFCKQSSYYYCANVSIMTIFLESISRKILWLSYCVSLQLQHMKHEVYHDVKSEFFHYYIFWVLLMMTFNLLFCRSSSFCFIWYIILIRYLYLFYGAFVQVEWSYAVLTLFHFYRIFELPLH